MNLLLVCDDLEETQVLSLVMQLAGQSVCATDDLGRAMEVWATEPANLVMLALRGLPLLQQARRVRAETEVPLIIVADGQEPEDRLYEAYDAGADVVVLRPYSARLLAAQVRALVRRSRSARLSGLPSLSVGELTLHPATRQVQVGAQSPRRLTHLEFRLLYTLMNHPGQTLPAEAIVERVWGYSGEGNVDLVRVLISRLRAKVESDPRNPAHIVTEPGVGYRLTLPARSPGVSEL